MKTAGQTFLVLALPHQWNPKSRREYLGLAIVARIIRNMDGQLRLKSEEGKEPRFFIQMPFTIPNATPVTPGDKSPIASPTGPRPHLKNDPSERAQSRPY